MSAFNTNNRWIKWLVLTTFLLFCVKLSFAQGILTINAIQPIHFGTICVTGPGGTVALGYDGQRSSTGNVLLLPVAPIAQPAIFEMKICEGGTFTLTFDATTILTNSNNKSTLAMDIGPTEKGINGASITINSDCINMTPLRVGGTLHIPDLAIPGIYSGSFAVTLNQE